MAQSLSKEKQELIEKIGVFHERNGMQPLMGRILGLLLILEEGEATFDEIIEYLKVSKSAVSTSLNFMQAKNQINYRTKPGDRKRYFYLTIGNWEKDIQKEMLEIVEIRRLMKEVLNLRGEKNPEMNKNIDEICEFLEYLSQRIPHLFEDFRSKRK